MIDKCLVGVIKLYALMKHKILIGFGVVAFLAACFLIGSAMYERPETFSRPMDLNRQDCRVGVLTGYESEQVGRRVYTHAQIVGFDDFEEAFMAVLAGTIDGFVYSDHVLNVGVRAYPNRLKILDESLANASSVVFLSPQRGDLLPELNRFIANCRKLDVYDDMVARWCQSDVFVPMPEIPEADGTQGVLRIGTSGEEEPSSFIDDDGNLTGFDIEFARRFAQMMGLKPEITCLPDGKILDALLAGELDMVIDNYTISEAVPGIRFSDVYFDSEMKVLVRADDQSGMMLGSTRFGFSRRLIKDPRLSLLVTGAVTTLLLLALTIFVAYLAVLGLWMLEQRVSPVQREWLVAAAHVVRFVPPPILVMIFSVCVFAAKLAWITLVLAIALWFVAVMEPVMFAKRDVVLKAFRERTIDLVHWTSLAGLLYVCDLFFAVDIICGRSWRAFGPLVSVASAYCLINWGITKLFDRLERKLW